MGIATYSCVSINLIILSLAIREIIIINQYKIFTMEGEFLHCIKCDGHPTWIEVTDDNVIVCAVANLNSIKFY